LTVTGGARLNDKPEEMSIKGRPLENAVSQMVNLSQPDKMDLGEAELAPIGVATGEDQNVGKDMLVDLAIHGIAREIAGLEQNTFEGHVADKGDERVLQDITTQNKKGPTWKRLLKSNPAHVERSATQQTKVVAAKRSSSENCDPNLIISKKNKKTKFTSDCHEEDTTYVSVTAVVQPRRS
jgi:hypothetical protein